MSHKLVSIIMPAYNCENYVAIAIDSVLSQTYAHIELLIADDCSKDSTKKIIDSYGDTRVRRFHNTTNLGYLKSCNLLAAHATGDYLTFLDADDINAPDRIEKQVKFLEEHTSIGCVGTNIFKIDSNGTTMGKSSFPLKHDDILRVFDNFGVPCHYSSLLIRKSVIETIGLYHPYFDRIGSEDVYWYSLVIDKFRVENLPETLYYYREHPQSVSRSRTKKDLRAFVGTDMAHLSRAIKLKTGSDLLASGNANFIKRYEEEKIALYLLKTGRYGEGLGKLIVTVVKHPKKEGQFYAEVLSLLKYKIKTAFRKKTP